MTDEELIAALREEDAYNERFYEQDPLHKLSADRIEAMVQGLKTAVAVVEESGRMRGQAEARADRLEALLREARIDLEHYVTHEYPKHLHPYYERQWNRDMELCRRIDAELKGEQQ